jgi:hypothetical protein
MALPDEAMFGLVEFAYFDSPSSCFPTRNSS